MNEGAVAEASKVSEATCSIYPYIHDVKTDLLCQWQTCIIYAHLLSIAHCKLFIRSISQGSLIIFNITFKTTLMSMDTVTVGMHSCGYAQLCPSTDG